MSNKKIFKKLFDSNLYLSDTLDLQNLLSQINTKKFKFSFIKKVTIQTSSDYTLSYLEDMLRLFLINRKIKPKINSTSFGSLSYLIRDLNDDFWQSQSDIFLLIPSSRKINFLPDINDNLKTIESKLKKESDIWIKMWKKTNKNIIQTTFDPLPYTNLGILDTSHSGGYFNYINKLNLILQENAPSNVNLIDLNTLNNQNKNFKLFDNKMYHLSKQPYSMDAIPHISNLISGLVAGINGMAKKVLVTDLDNTLWGGILGDDGLNNIRIGDTSPEGEGYTNFQKYLKSLVKKGIILCVCSKNDYKLAINAFVNNKQMELSKNDFTMFVANYEDKASNIKNISKSLNLSLDSFIFVDDSKIECELVRQKLPEVMVISLNNQDPSNFVEIVENTHPFYFKNITKEDLNRVKSYKQISLLNDKSKSISDLEKFLKELKPQILIKKVDRYSNERCAQLFAKTNQFKFNSNIFSSKQLISKNFTSLSINFKDKFHNYGVISSLVYKINKKDKYLLIENWVMSCRVFSRRIEDFIIDYLKVKTKENKCNNICFKLDLTKKNIYLQKFLKEMSLKINKQGQYSFNILNFKTKKKNYINEIN